MANFPNTIQLGDVRNVKGNFFVDLLAGGSPCQSFSFAGKRKGMSTTDNVEILTLDHYLDLKNQNFEFEGQSYLFWEYMRILEELRVINPNIKFLLENVLMGEKWQKILTRAIGINPIKINSALLSAQNRQRLYWTNIASVQDGLFGDLVCSISQPKDKGILLKDILETDVADKYFLSEKVTSRFKIGNLNDNIVGTTKGEENTRQGQRDLVYGHNGKMGCLMSTDYKQPKQIIVHNTMPRSSKTGKVAENTNVIEIQCVAMCVQKDNLVAYGCDYRTDEGLRIRENGKSGTLAARARNDESCGQLAMINKTIRRLTPIECERLQTVPDNYTNHVSDTQRYRMLGNGWTIDVITFILKHLWI
jgi:DNA (cytosine-5)-methyltransferase 3A